MGLGQPDEVLRDDRLDGVERIRNQDVRGNDTGDVQAALEGQCRYEFFFDLALALQLATAARLEVSRVIFLQQVTKPGFLRAVQEDRIVLRVKQPLSGWRYRYVASGIRPVAFAVNPVSCTE